MYIIYASVQCSERKFAELFADKKNKPGQEVQKYNRLLTEGLAVIGNEVHAICACPISRGNFSKIFFHKESEEQNGITYHYLLMINIHRIQDILTVLSSFMECYRLIKKNPEAKIICDILNAPVSLGAILASKMKHTTCVGIVTDIPVHVHSNAKALYCKVSNYIIGQCTEYIFLTESMNDMLNPAHKNYVVIEGISDIVIHQENTEKYEKKICMYTGALHKRYGIAYLIAGFIKAKIEGAELHIYGQGDYEEEIRRICEAESSVKYYGVKLSSDVVKEQKKATLLINPRPTNEEYTKYSFPSKNMEYMASGTPVLTTKLPGMPREYEPYVYLLEEESIQGMATALTSILAKTSEELAEKGKQAQEFVDKNKNKKMQAQKVMYIL